MTKLLTRFAPLAALFLTAAAPAMEQAVPVQAPAPPAAAQPPAAPVDVDPALWVVKDKDTTIYLFGTIHVLKPGLSWFDEAVKDAFDKSQELRLEMVMPDQKALLEIMVKSGVNPTGTNLSDKLPAAEKAKFQAKIKSLSFPAAVIDRMKPWLAATLILQQSLVQQGFQPGADYTLGAAAGAAGKPVSGFETAAEQFAYFNAMSDEDQIKYLVGTLNDVQDLNKSVQPIIGAWSAGDDKRIEKLFNGDVVGTGQVASILLTERNKRWADWIKTRMDQPGTVFVAVGAGHLAGKNSVQAELRKRGLKAKRVAY